MTAETFAQDLAAERLRGRLRWASVVLILSLFLPYENERGQLEFLWQLVGDLSLLGTLGALAPALVGLGVLIASCRSRADRLALGTLAGVLLACAALGIGTATSNWQWMGTPLTWAHRCIPSTIAIALSIASIRLAGEKNAIGTARALVDVGSVVGVLHLAMPSAGTTLSGLVVGALERVLLWPSLINVTCAAILGLLVFSPLVLVAVAWHCVRKQYAGKPTGVMIAGCTAAALSMPIVLRVLSRDPGNLPSVLSTAASLVFLWALLRLVETPTTFLGTLAALSENRTMAFVRRPRYLAVALGAGLLVLTGRWAVARSSLRSFEWVLGPGSPAAEQLFGTALPQWNDARALEDLNRQRVTKATPAVLRRSSTEAAQLAKEIDATLGQEINVLLREASQQSMTDSRWIRLVSRVNEASRRAGLPYYVDPTEVVMDANQEFLTWRRIDTYRIERIRQYTYQGRTYATLHVRWMDPKRSRTRGLGMSRDIQPFALVALDPLDRYSEELRRLALRSPPRCSEGDYPDSPTLSALQRCGQLSKEIVDQGTLLSDLIALVERHELQHQIDGAELPLPGVLAQRMRGLEREDQQIVSREVSATLAQITALGASPRLTLIRLLRTCLFTRYRLESSVGLLTLEALVDHPLDRSSREGIASAFQQLSNSTDDDLRALAGRAWKRLYGYELAKPRAR